MKYQVIIIGGGPAGYTAAESAGKAGLSVLLIEKNNLGGVCLNEGCIPTKTLLYSAKTYDSAKHASKYAINVSEVSFDLSKIIVRKSKVVRKLVLGVKRRKDFRKQGGNLISTTQDLEKAKQLLSDAGVSGGKIVVECSNGRDFEKTMMNYIALSWVDLGFDVTVNTPNQNYLYNKANGVYPFNQNDANIIVMDIQSMTTDAYSMLTAFSGEYGGHFIDVTTGPDEEDVVYGSHLTGFNDPAYDEICAKIVNAANTKDRTAAMHEAEQYLMEQLPIAPLFFNCDKYVSQKLSGIKYDKYGRMNLTKLKQSNYKKYLPTDETN